MWDRRQFLIRSGGTVMGLSAGGLVWRALAQDDANQARGMITPATQVAIDQGLAFLAGQQAGDGSYGNGQQSGSVAITALAGLAFMAGGNQPGRGRYGQNVTRAVEFILSCAQHNGAQVRGWFLNNPRSGGHGPMYGHGFATLFLAEVYGMVNEPRLRNQLRQTLHESVQLIISAQNNDGGWRYQPRPGDADLSVTICQIMARAARNAGIAVPKTVADNCTKYVKDCQDLHNTGGFRYQKHGGGPGFARTAAGVVALYSAGIYEGESVEKGLKYLRLYKPGNAQGGFLGNLEQQMHYFYGHYYAVQAMWIRGGEYWREWYPAIRNELLNSRQANGSWDMSIQLGSHYSTAMALIILQVPNNYLPILQR